MKGEIALTPCSSFRCHDQAASGRKQAEPHRELCSHCAELVRIDLLDVAHIWQDLEAGLVAAASGLNEKVQTSGKPGISLDDRVSQAIDVNVGRALELANIAKIRVDREALLSKRFKLMPVLLRTLAVAWKRLAYHVDPDTSVYAADQARFMSRSVGRAAYPDHVKRIEIPHRCIVRDSSGRACKGRLYALVWTGTLQGSEIRCEVHPEHVMPAAQWWRRFQAETVGQNRAAMTRFMDALDIE